MKIQQWRLMIEVEIIYKSRFQIHHLNIVAQGRNIKYIPVEDVTDEITLSLA